jgi:glyoxylase-like metal-dependent hydrolase (beta-lactamase superfamily II)
MILEIIKVGPMQVNCYILASESGGQAIIIDPGDDVFKIRSVLDRHKLKPAMVINTHGHYDHIGGDDEFGVPVYVHQEDLPMLVDARKNLSAVFSTAYKVNAEIRTLQDQEIIKLGCLELKVIHLPVHTPGGIGLLMEKPQTDIIFTGDTLFYHSFGRSDLPGGSRESLEKAIKDRLFVLPDDMRAYPGHGPVTTIGQERNSGLLEL